MITLILIIVVISILILVHEWGHFYSARRLGIKVEEFGFGFPPKVFSRVKNGITYSFNLLPFGGFVRIFGEHGEGEGETDSFISRPPWQRFIILGAGVFMNLVLAWVFFSAGSVAGVPRLSDDENLSGVPVSIIGVMPDSPAMQAGIRFGDAIFELRSRDISLRVETEDDVRDFVAAYRGEEITMVLKRGSEIREVFLRPRVNVPEGEGPIGVALGRIEFIKTSWYLAPIEGGRVLVRTVSATVSGFWELIRELAVSGRAPVAVSGPVGIFFVADDTRSLGVTYFLQFIGILSVNLAILNFLPIPALDGGRVLFLVIEKIKGSRVDPRVENMIHAAGFVLLVVLMILVTYRDVVKIL
ncbi:MAG: site-2 protease family protein [Candidatus Sungbacteria bacterium]|nr:site-2 protease family protein [Candidatus Sungbacteria bacterium]